MEWPATNPASALPLLTYRNIAARHLLNYDTRLEVFMVTPVLHRKWAREFLIRAEQAPTRVRKQRYLRLAVSNTMRAHKLEARPGDEMTDGGEKGSAEKEPTPKH